MSNSTADIIQTVTKYLFSLNGFYFGSTCYDWIIRRKLPKYLQAVIRREYINSFIKLLKTHYESLNYTNNSNVYEFEIGNDSFEFKLTILLNYSIEFDALTSISVNNLVYNARGLTIYKRADDELEEEISPFQVIVGHIKSKYLHFFAVPQAQRERVKLLSCLKSYFANGWVIDPSQEKVVMNNIKLRKISQVEDNPDNTHTCLICKETFKQTDAILIPDQCKHYCHAGCILKWFEMSKSETNTCPYCQKVYGF